MLISRKRLRRGRGGKSSTAYYFVHTGTRLGGEGGAVRICMMWISRGRGACRVGSRVTPYRRTLLCSCSKTAASQGVWRRRGLLLSILETTWFLPAFQGFIQPLEPEFITFQTEYPDSSAFELPLISLSPSSLPFSLHTYLSYLNSDMLES